ncbi:MAG: hypothetical protein H0T84_14385 [Tatlockia sp.]|nr:hypothetical protein [Tatlockia sp.]
MKKDNLGLRRNEKKYCEKESLRLEYTGKFFSLKTAPRFYSEIEQINDIPIIFLQLIKYLRIFEKISSAKFMANFELSLGIVSLLAFIATPIAFYAAYLESLNYCPNSSKLLSVANSLLLMILLVVPITFVCSSFFVIVLIDGYKEALKKYNSLSYCLADQSEADKESINNLIKLLNTDSINHGFKNTLEIFNKFRTEYEGIYTFWKSSKTNIFPPEIFRKIMNSTEHLLMAEKDIDEKRFSVKYI